RRVRGLLPPGSCEQKADESSHCVNPAYVLEAGTRLPSLLQKLNQLKLVNGDNEGPEEIAAHLPASCATGFHLCNAAGSRPLCDPAAIIPPRSQKAGFESRLRHNPKLSWSPPAVC
ncbi:hypothetical protein GOP47_0020292, partial [Adiantum capillus-veneris]